MSKLAEYKAKAQPIRDAINARPLTDFYQLKKSGSGYCCPICGSGTGENKTGALFIQKMNNRVTCFSNGCFSDGIHQGTDTLGALKILHSGYSEQEIFKLCGYSLSDNPSSIKAIDSNKAKTADNPAVKYDFVKEIAEYAAALENSPAQTYLEQRGLTLDTMRKFKLGYNEKKNAVTIPYNAQCSYYGQRRITEDEMRVHDNLPGVPVPLFNPDAIYASDVCFIVESPLCAISIEQIGGKAVAISGTSGKSRLVTQLKQRPTRAALALCLDNDDPGRKTANELSKDLDELGVFYINVTVVVMGDGKGTLDYRKDPNECLMRDGVEAFTAAINDAIDYIRQAHNANTQEATQERQQRTGVEMVDSFLQAIQTRRYEPIPTGIKDIDSAIGGGFMRQQLVLLGAAPGVGKTALAQWIFQGMAKEGIDCLYLNLEMSREQMLARSVSNIATKQGFKINANTVLKGYAWTEEQRKAIFAAADEYKSTIAQHMIYNLDGVAANLDTILNYIDKEAREAVMAQKSAPIVILDYLQLVSGQPHEDETTVIKRAVSELKNHAVKHNTVVFVIIAHNRKSNSSGFVSMESGRDTSALEYSADLQLALAYTRCLKRRHQQAKTPDELTADEKKLITLVVTKARFGGQGRVADLYFDGETMTYTQTAHEFTEFVGKTPFEQEEAIWL